MGDKEGGQGLSAQDEAGGNAGRCYHEDDIGGREQGGSKSCKWQRWQDGGKVSAFGDNIDLLVVRIQVGNTNVILRRQAFVILKKIQKDVMATASIKV